MFTIDWFAFAKVFAAALTGAVTVVFFYSIGVRMLVRAGRVPRVTDAELTDAIMIVTKKDIRRAERAAEKAAKRPPLTRSQEITALVVAWASFAMCAAAAVAGILLIVVGHRVF